MFMFTPLVYHREDAITPKEGLRSCNPMVVDDAGQAVRMVGTGQDITEHTRQARGPQPRELHRKALRSYGLKSPRKPERVDV